MDQFSLEYTAYMLNGQSIGHGTWRNKKRRYWSTWWTRKRCLICCRADRRKLTLHHLHYDHLGNEHLLDLRPLCWTPCHMVVTFVSRVLRRMTVKHPVFKATYLVWFVARFPLIVITVLLLRL